MTRLFGLILSVENQQQPLVDSYSQAANIYFTCRRKGITVRSTVDCVIAQIAIEHELILLHNDKDFENIAKVFPDLNLWKSSANTE